MGNDYILISQIFFIFFSFTFYSTQFLLYDFNIFLNIFQKTNQFSFHLHLKICLLILERGKGRENEREGNINRLPLILTQLGIEPPTQVCALTGNQTCDLSVYRTTLYPTEPPQPVQKQISFIGYHCDTCCLPEICLNLLFIDALYPPNSFYCFGLTSIYLLSKISLI